MAKKCIVRLTDEERETLGLVVKKLKGASQKVRRAQVLLKADAAGPNWTDNQIADGIVDDSVAFTRRRATGRR